MAFVFKSRAASQRNTDGYHPFLSQWIRTSRATDTLPQTASEDIFTVSGGRILVKALIGEVTTAVGAGTTPDLNVYVNSSASATNEVIATDLVIASDIVGTLYSVEGDSTALLEGDGAVPAANGSGFVVNPGTIGLTTSESVAGSVKWDIYWMPLDAAALVTPTAV